MNKPTLSRVVCILFVFCAATAIASRAQVLTTLHTFAGYPSDGANPDAGLVQATDGNFYGTTHEGGASDDGTVFKITPSGALTTLYSFCSQSNCSDGAHPQAGLVQANDGNFYGTTFNGGASQNCGSDGCGTVFKITPNGTLTTLYSFNGSDGENPFAGLVQATDGNFYGTTQMGGANCAPDGCGTVFKITPNGALTTLHSFNGSDGYEPYGGLVQASDGDFYGTTARGAAYGTVFKITPNGTLTVLHSFDGSDGEYPFAGLVQGSDGNFYGTTAEGGASGNCSGGCGTVFKITPNGTLATLHRFNGSDGGFPVAALIQANDGNFYGTTYGAGFQNGGTIFRITPNGTLTVLYGFGSGPYAPLIQASDGNFYGTTPYGGANDDGTVFRLVLSRPCIVCPSVE